MALNSDWRDWPPIAILFGGLVLVYLAYIPGFGAPAVLDSPANLSGLKGVSDVSSALEFALGGGAGPLGRPIALASFLISPADWPNDIPALIRGNVLIHLCNGLLVAWAGFLLARLHLGKARQAAYAGVLAGLLWVSSPILVSATLMPVQRMTSLAALFMMLGLVSHIYCRELVRRRPLIGWLSVSGSLAVFTLLAALSKENGSLLPLLVLVVELSLLKSVPGQAPWLWRAWKLFFLVTPAMLLVGFVAAQWQYPESTRAWRGFDASERLLTQSVVLWEYLLHTIRPSMRGLGPFADGYPVYTGFWSPVVVLATLGWGLVIASAVIFRKHLPLFTFAVAWFIGMHLIESTIIPLELYFEHRNYVPLIGPIMALAIGAQKLSVRHMRFAMPALGLFFLLATAVTYNTASLWANRPQLAEVLYEENPESHRAALYRAELALSRYDFNEVSDIFYEARVNTGHEALFELAIGDLECVLDREASLDSWPSSTTHALAIAPFSHAMIDQIRKMVSWRIEQDCSLYDLDDVVEMIEHLLDNPAYQGGSVAQGPLYDVLGKIAQARDDVAGALASYRLSMEANPSIELGEESIELALEHGRLAWSCEQLEQLVKQIPRQAFRKFVWRAKLADVRSRLEHFAKCS